MQAIELETTIVNGEIHAKLPSAISTEHARLIVLYELPAALENTVSGLVQMLDNISSQRSWPTKTKAEIDSFIETERAAWDNHE